MGRHPRLPGAPDGKPTPSAAPRSRGWNTQGVGGGHPVACPSAQGFAPFQQGTPFQLMANPTKTPLPGSPEPCHRYPKAGGKQHPRAPTLYDSLACLP